MKSINTVKTDGSFLKSEGQGGVLTTPNIRISIQEAAKILGVKPKDVETLVKQELLNEITPGFFKAEDITRLTTKKTLSLADEAAQVGIGLQRAIAATLNVLRVIAITVFAAAVGYSLIVEGFVVAYSYQPTPVASWVTQKNPPILQALIQPAGMTALGILKYAQPTAYKEVVQTTIINPNDVLTVGRGGSITPTGPLVIPTSSYLQVLTKGLVTNLNSDLLQGRIPGTTTGNIAVIGSVQGLSDNAVETADITDGAVTNAKLAQITDANKVAGSAIEIKSGGGLTHGSGLTLLTSCSDSQVLQWNASNSAWECASEVGSTAAGITSIREGGATIVNIPTSINFDGNAFTATESATGVGNISIDYTNSTITRGNQNEVITGLWTLPTGTTVGSQTFTTHNILDSGALTIATTTTGALTLDSGTTGGINIGNGGNAKAIVLGNSTAGTTLALTGGATWSINSSGNLSTTGTVSTTGTGAITSAGTLTASNGLTLSAGTINLTGTSGALALSGLGDSSINTGSNVLTITSSNINTTATGINSTAIGASTPSTGAFSSLSSTGTTNLGQASGVVTVNSSGALNLTGASPSTWTLGANALTLTSSNINISSTGVITLAGGQTQDLTTATGTNPTRLTIRPGANTTNSGTGALLNISGGNETGTTSTGGGLALTAGTGTSTNGVISIGTTNTSAITIGATGITTTNTGALTSTQTLTASNGLTLTTGAINLNGTSGALSLTGLTASSINTSGYDLTITSANFSTTHTGINGTVIGASTAAAGTFSTLTGSTSITDSGLTANGVVTNTAGGLLGTLAGTTTTVLHGSASGLPTFSSVTGSDLASGITISTTGDISTTGTGKIISASLLTGSNGLTLTTGAINLNGTSGILSLNGLSASAINTGSYDLTITSSNFKTTSTGINGTVIGASTAAAGTFTTLTGLTFVLGTNTAGNILVADGSKFISVPMIGDATASSSGIITLNYDGAQSADSTHKGFLTAANWVTFNSKQEGLGFTPENVASKSANTSLGTSDVLYPTQNAVKTYVDAAATGLVWENPVEAINVVADAAAPPGAPANLDVYVIDSGGVQGAWSTFAEGDLVQYQTGPGWKVLKSLALNDYFGIAFKSSTALSGDFSGKKNYIAKVTGGTASNWTFTLTAPTNSHAVYVQNANAYYHDVAYVYSNSLTQWVQLSASASFTFANGLTTSGTTISLGPLTGDWTQSGAFNINTAGDIGVNGGDLTTTNASATVFNANATTLNIGGAATTIGLGAAGATVTGGGALSIKSGNGTALTIDSGTTGNLNIGNSANAKAIVLGSSTAGTTLALTGGTAWSINSSGILSTTGSVSTTGTGTMTSAGLLTASNGLALTTGAINLTGVSGALALSGLSASSIATTGGADLNFTTGHFNTTVTGINSTAIGADASASGKFTSLSGNSITDLGLSANGVVTNTSAGLLGTLAGTTTTVLHGNASGLPTFSSVSGNDLAANITISTTGNITTTSGGTITSAGLLTASNGLTLSAGALNLTASSGALTLSGLGASSIDATGNALTFTSTNFNTTATGINGTAIGASTAAAGTFTSLTSTGTSNIGSGTGVVTLNSSGALNLTGASPSTWTLGANALTLTSSNFNVDSTGVVTLAGGLTQDLTTGTGHTTLTVRPGVNTTNSGTGALLTLSGGNESGTTSTGGSLALTAGTGTSTNGTITIGTTNTNAITIGATGITTTNTGALTSTQTLTASNGLTLTTGVLNLTGSSGAISLTGLTTASINASGHDLTITSANFNTTATGINGTAIGATTAAAGTFSSVTDSGLSVSSLVYTDGSRVLTSTAPATGTLAFWNRAGTTLSPGTAADAITTSGTISTSGSGAITSAGLLTASNGLTLSTGAINLTGGSGALTLTGLGASTISATSAGLTLRTVTSGALAVTSAGALSLTGAAASTWTLGANALTLTSSNFNVSSTGAVTLNGGLTADILTPAGTALTIDSGTTGTINIGNSANAKTINMGTGAAVIETINIGGTGANIIKIGNTQSGGTIGIGAGTSTASTTIGNSTGTLALTGSTWSMTTGGALSAVSATASGNITMGGQLQVGRFAADPTAVGNGSMYYNTTTNKFKCYENGAWANCITATSGGTPNNIKTSNVFGTPLIVASQTNALATSVSITTGTNEVMVSASLEFDMTTTAGNDHTAYVYRDGSACGTGGTQLGNTYTINHKTASDKGTIAMTLVEPSALTAASHTYRLCVTTAAGGTVTKANLTAMEVILGADVAELYGTNDTSIAMGDVVSVDPNLSSGIKKSGGTYDSNVIGVVSTLPGVLMGGGQKDGTNAVPVALSGRIPVKVNTENGPVVAGDYLTSSSTPGVAMKATSSGLIIGTAMTSFDGEGIGTVIVFVKNGTSLGTGDVLGQLFNESINSSIKVMGSTATASGETETFMNKLFDQLIAWFADTTNKIGDLFAKKVHTDELCLKKSDGTEVCVNGDQMDKLMPTNTPTPTPIPTEIPIPTDTPSASPSSTPIPTPSESASPSATPTIFP